MPRHYLTRLTILLSTIFLAVSSLCAQTLKLDTPKPGQDTTKVRTQSPSRAALYSAILPGLGQAYNKKYWKIPIVYAGFGVMGYFIVSNGKEYMKFKDAYDYKNAGANPDPKKYNEYVDKYTIEELQSGRDYYRRNRDLTIIVTSFWYLMNIVDAAVDAYLFDYDITDDLSLRVAPTFNPMLFQTKVPAELKLTFRIGSH